MEGKEIERKKRKRELGERGRGGGRWVGKERKGGRGQEGAGEGVGKVKTGAEHQRARRERERGWG